MIIDFEPQGIDGVDGQPGVRGAPGTRGATGNPGVDGPPGPFVSCCYCFCCSY